MRAYTKLGAGSLAAQWAIALIWLAACTLTHEESSPQAVRATLAARLAEAQNAQMVASTLWARLIAGEAVSCQEAIPTPPLLRLNERELRAHPAAASVQGALNTALQAIRDAEALWQSACATPNTTVPLETARAARDAVRTASAALEQAAALLATW